MTIRRGQNVKTADIPHSEVHTEDMVPRQEQQCGVGGKVVWKLLCVIRESETGICRTWCVVSRLDIVGGVARADGGEEQEGQQRCHDNAL